MPLSNPGRLAEVDPKDANEWTQGRALLASGNALIYPGLGFGAMITQAKSMTDTMIIAGTQRLASLAPALKDPGLPLLPDFSDAPEVNYEVAVAVAEQAIEEGSAGVKWQKGEAREKIRQTQWIPVYRDFSYDPEGLH
ncbi:hypothetical protein NM688_g7766 [Phlebia brevispora]|uniref:Uncharacterized protein n=1 Tax=Phlebia brevispora TaxID=194682 RepID=A0ACC1S1C5_9APHY|nr:hypothetical protein NM688_g7766 [Phlebia brevispora]